MKFCFLSLLMLISLFSFSQDLTLQLIDEKSNDTIPYAHISSQGKLVAISDHFGRARIPESLEATYQITCVGFRPLTFSSQILTEHKVAILKLNPDDKILDAITITPTTLEDMIKEVYDQISNKYISEPHLLEGKLSEKYMDTIGHVHIKSIANLKVQKEAYTKPHNKGQVKLDSLSRIYDVAQPLYAQIHAGAHIPHRFDFVMRREEFINPLSFNKYDYEYLGELELDGRVVDVIGFEPNPKSLLEGQFAGKLYLDMKEKLFLKAEYHYTKTGIFSNPESRWVDRRQFITEYKAGEEGWYFAYTWDEAVRKSDNFLLSQFFETTSVDFDTLVDWSYDERTHFHEVVEKKPADTLIVINEMPMVDSIPQVEFTRTSTGLYKLMSKLETGLGLKVYNLYQGNIDARADLNYHNTTLDIDQQFSIPTVDLGLFVDLLYKISNSLYVRFSQSESFSQKVRKGHWDLALMYRIRKKQGRPSDFNFLLGYGEYVSRFKFDKQNDVRPFYQQRHRGLTGGVSYQLRLNARWKFGLSYNYFYALGAKEKFYLKEHYGLFNMFSRKHDYSTDMVNWEVNGEAQNTAVNIFSYHSFDISLIMALP